MSRWGERSWTFHCYSRNMFGINSCRTVDKMSFWCVLLVLSMSTCVLGTTGYDNNEVICSQGLSSCTVEDETALNAGESDTVAVENLTAFFNLSCEDRKLCALCLVIGIEVRIRPDLKDTEDEEASGFDHEDGSEETKSSKESVTVCYKVGNLFDTCKKVEFTVNHAVLTQENQAKLSMQLTEPAGVSFGSQVFVRTFKPSLLISEGTAPSLDQVCSEELQERVRDCQAPRLSTVINREMNRIELQFPDRKKRMSLCVQYEQKGSCRPWRNLSVPLSSVMSCMCFQVWDEEDQRSRRTLSCPFKNQSDEFKDVFQRNVWQNMTVSVGPGQMTNHQSMLQWNISAPCRLEGEVWPCHRRDICREVEGFRQQLTNSTWEQNKMEHWEKRGAFEDIDLQLSPCVMVKLKGIDHDLGPFCFNNTDRCRWSLLVVGLLLLVCLTVVIFYLLHDFVKKWVWSWHHGRFVEIGRKRHVVLLSPPDLDDGLSESVCRLGSLLSGQGFSVSVDLMSRREQCTLGPVPWLYSQLPELKSQGGRVVLILTHKAMERAEEWTHRHNEVVKTKGEDKCTDVFTASLCLIHAEKQQSRAGEHFLLVKFDSHPSGGKKLPELFQGLPLFQLPAQTRGLLSELTVGRDRRRSDRRRWRGWRWRWRWREKSTKEQNPQIVLQNKHNEAKKNFETEPLKHPETLC